MPHRPLKCRVVERVLKLFGLEQVQNTSGTSHEQWEGMYGGIKRKVTLDCHGGEVRALDVKSIIGPDRLLEEGVLESGGALLKRPIYAPRKAKYLI